MREIAWLFEDEKYESAWRLAVELERQITEVARLTGDAQMYDDAALMRKYQETLSEAVWKTQGKQPHIDEDSEPADGERPYRGDESDPDLPEVDIE
jgi:hypothetical protein